MAEQNDKQSNTPARPVKASKIAAGKPGYEERNGVQPPGKPGQPSALYRTDDTEQTERQRQADRKTNEQP